MLHLFPMCMERPTTRHGKPTYVWVQGYCQVTETGYIAPPKTYREWQATGIPFKRHTTEQEARVALLNTTPVQE